MTVPYLTVDRFVADIKDSGVGRKMTGLRQAVDQLRSIVQSDACKSVKSESAVAQCGHALCVECLDGKVRLGHQLRGTCQEIYNDSWIMPVRTCVVAREQT